MYVGHSNRTERSSTYQYLELLLELRYRPQFFRSDHGIETTDIGEVQLTLLRETRPDATLDDCYFFGTSTKNQRIEAWWSQLTKSLNQPVDFKYIHTPSYHLTRRKLTM